MSRNNKTRTVYSTDPDFQYEEEKILQETLSPDKQHLKLILDKKTRKGKEATLVQGFVGTLDDLKVLGKKIKKICAVGGSVKNNEIIIQGDVRNKIFEILQKEGYNVKKI